MQTGHPLTIAAPLNNLDFMNTARGTLWKRAGRFEKLSAGRELDLALRGSVVALGALADAASTIEKEDSGAGIHTMAAGVARDARQLAYRWTVSVAGVLRNRSAQRQRMALEDLYVDIISISDRLQWLECAQAVSERDKLVRKTSPMYLDSTSLRCFAGIVAVSGDLGGYRVAAGTQLIKTPSGVEWESGDDGVCAVQLYQDGDTSSLLRADRKVADELNELLETEVPGTFRIVPVIYGSGDDTTFQWVRVSQLRDPAGGGIGRVSIHELNADLVISQLDVTRGVFLTSEILGAAVTMKTPEAKNSMNSRG